MNRQLRGLVGVADEVLHRDAPDDVDTLRHWLLYAPDPLRMTRHEHFLCIGKRRPDKKQTHEFFMVALNPALDPWNLETILTRPLSNPKDFCILPPWVHFAFGPLRDDQAMLVCDGVVEAMCKGSLPLDPGTNVLGTQLWHAGMRRIVTAVTDTGGLPIA